MGIKDADKPEDFLTALYELQKACGVENLKMSDYGFTQDEFMKLAVNARETNPGLYAANPCELTDEDAAEIYRRYTISIIQYEDKAIAGSGSDGSFSRVYRPLRLQSKRKQKHYGKSDSDKRMGQDIPQE